MEEERDGEMNGNGLMSGGDELVEAPLAEREDDDAVDDGTANGLD